MKAVIGFLAGLLFGIGLFISGMSDPAKVLNFLDIFWTWDPSLAFVMGGASITTFIAYRIVLRREARAFGTAFHMPKATAIDRPLIVGAMLFGVGWGLGEFCPGPAWTALPLAAPGTLIFIPAMLIGLWLGRRPQLVRIIEGRARHV